MVARKGDLIRIIKEKRFGGIVENYLVGNIYEITDSINGGERVIFTDNRGEKRYTDDHTIYEIVRKFNEEVDANGR